MNPTNLEETHQILKVNPAERWQIYHRLRELDIPCQCASDRPLQVRLDNTKSAIQLWSVVRQFSAPRSELVRWLDECWQIKTDTKDN